MKASNGSSCKQIKDERHIQALVVLSSRSFFALIFLFILFYFCEMYVAFKNLHHQGQCCPRPVLLRRKGSVYKVRRPLRGGFLCIENAFRQWYISWVLRKAPSKYMRIMCTLTRYTLFKISGRNILRSLANNAIGIEPILKALIVWNFRNMVDDVNVGTQPDVSQATLSNKTRFRI